MTKMTREDVLRELELLPAWQLRTPLPIQSTIVENVLLTKPPDVEAGPNAVLAKAFVNNAEEVSRAAYTVTQVTTPVLVEMPEIAYMATEDHSWLFILGNAKLTADEAHLLHNISIALRIKLQPVQTTLNISALVADIQVKRVVVLGELIAQHLLSTQSLLDDMRGTVHTWQGVPLVVTYALAHLLKVPADKENAWHDLCLVFANV